MTNPLVLLAAGIVAGAAIKKLLFSKGEKDASDTPAIRQDADHRRVEHSGDQQDSRDPFAGRRVARVVEFEPDPPDYPTTIPTVAATPNGEAQDAIHSQPERIREPVGSGSDHDLSGESVPADQSVGEAERAVETNDESTPETEPKQ